MKLAVIGASYLQLPLVKKARSLGIQTHCFAWEDGAVCKEHADFFYPISILDKDLILEKCVEIGINGITTIASDAAVPTMCYIAEQMDLIGNSYNSSLLATNKYDMRKCFKEHDVPSPAFVFARQGVPMASDMRFPLIVKPTDRSGSRGVTKVESQKQLEESITRARKESFSNQAIVEEFITGREISVESISWKGTHYILAITDKVTSGEPYFVELEHHQPASGLTQEMREKIIATTQKALTALRIEYGAGHTEMKITSSGDVFLIEVGARMGGDFIGSNLVELSTGYDFVKGVISVALGNFDAPLADRAKYSGVYFLTKLTERIQSVIVSKDSYAEIVEAEITDADLRDVKCSADRSGYFIYQADTKFIL